MSQVEPGLRSSTLIYASLGTVLTGCLAYAVYFDYKRRNDADFRRALKREARQQAKAAKVEAEQGKQAERRQLRDMVDQANEEGFPVDAEEKESYFMSQVGEGEQTCQDPTMLKQAALCFFKAIKVYPQPNELMNIYDKTVPKPVLDILAEMVAYDRGSNFGSSNSSSAGVE